MILDTTAKTIEVVLGTAITTNQLEITADWVDTANGSTFVPGATSLLTNSTTAVTAVASPASNVQRQVKALTIYNADTVNQTVTVRGYDGTNRRRFVSAALAPGQSLVFTPEGGWSILTAAPGQIIGTSTNDNAAAGNVGEFISLLVGTGSAVGMSSNTPANIGSISLSPGDWDVTGAIQFIVTGTTTVVYVLGSFSSTSGTTDTTNGRMGQYLQGSVAGAVIPLTNVLFALPVDRRSLSATTSIYLVGQAGFGVSTLSMCGLIRARRVR